MAANRFVVLRHTHPVLHWDLLLEVGDRCRTWRLLSEPTANSVVAEAIGDHRPFYLTYEGPVAGDRGEVTRWDAGTFETVASEASDWLIELNGSRLIGRFEIVNDADADRARFRRVDRD